MALIEKYLIMLHNNDTINSNYTKIINNYITFVTVWGIDHNTILQFYTLLFNSPDNHVKSLYIYIHSNPLHLNKT